MSASVGLDLRQFAPSLRLDDGGIWVSDRGAPVSYPAHGNSTYFQVEDGSFWFQHRNQILISVMRRWLPPGDVIFDVGGGNGFVARALQDAGWPVVLVEPGSAGAANAHRSRGVVNVACTTLQEAGLKDAALPALGLFDVVEHIEDEQQFLTKVHDLLTPGGRLFLTVPAYGWLWSTEDEDAGHYRRYSAASLRRALDCAGFELAYDSFFFGMLPVPIFLLRALPSKLKLRPKVTLEKTRQEHAGSGSHSWLLTTLLKREQRKIAAGKRLGFGSSIVAVARRKA